MRLLKWLKVGVGGPVSNPKNQPKRNMPDRENDRFFYLKSPSSFRPAPSYIARFEPLEPDSIVRGVLSASNKKIASVLGHGYSYEAPKMAEGGRGPYGFKPQESAQTEYARPRYRKKVV